MPTQHCPQSPKVTKWLVTFDVSNDTQTGMPLGIPRGARCVQIFNDSRNSAIHITYRISLRSSSMREPRDPLLKVVFIWLLAINTIHYSLCKKVAKKT